MRITNPDEFDRIFDDGEQSILDYVDWSTAYRTGEKRQFVSVSLPDSLVASLDGEAKNQGLDRDRLIEKWLSHRLGEQVA
ncbi:MAG: hypothetical protein LBI84_10695 [Propionibacteriaceae bacterium]|jgi:hypothetical protein|nr:hypothetical protein [Propionibacteriaceae bacterium]